MFELLGIQLLSYIFSPFLQQERERKIWIEKQDDKSADAFNMIGIDTEHKLLRVLRIGSNYDGYFRPCDALTVDYSNLNNIKVWA